MENMSVYIKFIPKGLDNFKYLLVATCEITNLVLAIWIKLKAAQVVVQALIHRPIYILVP